MGPIKLLTIMMLSVPVAGFCAAEEVPIDFSYDPIQVTGRLSVHFDAERGLFYRLEEARLKR